MAIIYPKNTVIYQHQMKPETYQHTMEANGPKLGLSPEDLIIAIETKAEESYHLSTTTDMGEYDYIKSYTNRILNKICNL